MQRHSRSQSPYFAPRLVHQAVLGRYGGGKSLRGQSEGGAKLITDGLEHVAAVSFDRVTQESIMAS
jgi:hypothetical protein